MNENYNPPEREGCNLMAANSIAPNDAEQAAPTDLALLDHLTYTVTARYKVLGGDPIRRLASGLQAQGLLRTSYRPGAPLRLRIKVQLERGVVATATVVLYVQEINGGLVIGSASTLKTNLQHVVRARYGIPDAVIGLDGKRNFSKATAECSLSDLELQFVAIEELFRALLAAIRASLPDSRQVDGFVKFRRAEVCHDSAYANAEDIARATCRVPPRGSRETSQREYACTTGAGRTPTWRVVTKKRGPAWKGYVKAPGLLRTEFTCDHRDAVFHCMGERTQAPFSPDGAVQLAIDFYNKGGEQLCEALDHVRKVAEGGRYTLHDLLVRLDVLKAVADRDRVGNGYRPSERAAADAQRILIGLLSEGIAYATGLRKGTKVRDILEELAAPGGPLVRGATLGIFCLAPEYGMAVPGWKGEFPLVLRG